MKVSDRKMSITVYWIYGCFCVVFFCDQIALMTFTLVPMRALLSFCCLLLCWFWAVVALSGRLETDAEYPLSGWRKWVLHVMLFIDISLILIMFLKLCIIIYCSTEKNYGTLSI